MSNKVKGREGVCPNSANSTGRAGRDLKASVTPERVGAYPHPQLGRSRFRRWVPWRTSDYLGLKQHLESSAASS